MHWVETERFRYEAHQVILGDKAPWLSPTLPSQRGFVTACTAVVFLSLLLNRTWMLMMCGLLLMGAVYGLGVLMRRAIKVCPWCYESVAGGAHHCRCGFSDGQRY